MRKLIAALAVAGIVCFPAYNCGDETNDITSNKIAFNPIHLVWGNMWSLEYQKHLFNETWLIIEEWYELREGDLYPEYSGWKNLMYVGFNSYFGTPKPGEGAWFWGMKSGVVKYIYENDNTKVKDNDRGYQIGANFGWTASYNARCSLEIAYGLFMSNKESIVEIANAQDIGFKKYSGLGYFKVSFSF
jgi:hypothetical protein